MQNEGKIIALNWKSYLGISESVQLSKHIIETHPSAGQSLIIAPSCAALADVSKAIGKTFGLCAQNFDMEAGAQTGATTIAAIKEAGCGYSIVGHSELRYGRAKESDGLIAKKVAMCTEYGLIPIICVGERSEEKEAGKTEEFVSAQVESAISGIKDKGAPVIFAYEPVWAISSNAGAKALDPDSASSQREGSQRKVPLRG
jgi:triosephosphate isomerase (TIM)